MSYRHTQIGWPVVSISFVVLPLLMIAMHGWSVTSLPLVLLVITMLLFGTLTVSVNENRISWHFGLGLIRKSVPIRTIRSVRAVRNPWYYGWGIRFTPVGWLYNVSGLSAVDLGLDDGRHVMIGTDEPEALERALQHVGVPLGTHETVLARPPSRRALILVILGINALIIPVVLWSVYIGAQPPSVEVSPAMFSVRSGFYSANVPIASIREISLQDTIPRVTLRTNGLAAGAVLRGNFRLEVLGAGKLFINRGAPPYIVVKTMDSFVIVNFVDTQRTRAVYDELRRYVR
jgi:hypothetical protein